MLFINGPVVVVMAEQPVVIMCSLLDLLQKICERVCLIVAVFHESNVFKLPDMTAWAVFFKEQSR